MDNKLEIAIVAGVIVASVHIAINVGRLAWKRLRCEHEYYSYKCVNKRGAVCGKCGKTK